MRFSIIAALFLTPALASVYTDPSMLPNASYTYIIVGGRVHPSVRGYLVLSNTCPAGPGGSVLANRLSANPNNRVLLIEAGPRFVSFYIYLCLVGGL